MTLQMRMSVLFIKTYGYFLKINGLLSGRSSIFWGCGPMARPLRIEFPGAVYHVTSRGQRREAIYEDDADREVFQDILTTVARRFHWKCYAYCQMTNSYHLLIRTMDATLSTGMRYLNGVYTQASNRRHDRSGHVFQGRYKAILVDPEKYLLEMARYIVLKPVRARVADTPGAWPWSSYGATAGEVASPHWLAVDELLEEFEGGPEEKRERYRKFVLDGLNTGDPRLNVRHQLYLGDEEFIRQVQKIAGNSADSYHQPGGRSPAPNLDELAARAPTRDDAIVAAYKTGAYSYADIAKYFGLHPNSIGRIVRPRL